MRKSESFSKDYLTGVVRNLEKLKPVDQLYKGIHNVKLFREADGKLVHETNSENFVSVTWEDIQRSYAKASLLASSFNYGNDMTLGGSSSYLLTNQDNFYSIYGYYPPSSSSPWTNMLLTDYVEPERPTTERAVFGNLIGWAGRETAYSGSSTTQGSFNLAESNKDLNAKKFHFVWDFATQAANGTFQSIYFNMTDTRNYLSYIPLHKWAGASLSPPTGYGFVTGVRGMIVRNNKVYILVYKIADSSKGIAIYDLDTTTWNATPSATPLIAFPSAPTANYSFFDIDMDSVGDFYLMSQYGTIYKYDGITGASKNFSNGLGYFTPNKTYASSSFNRGLVIDKNDIMYINYNGSGIPNEISAVTSVNGIVSYRLSDLSKVSAKSVFTSSSDNIWFIKGYDYDYFQWYENSNGYTGTISTNITDLNAPSPSNLLTPIQGSFVLPGSYAGSNIIKYNGEPVVVSYNETSITNINLRAYYVGRIGGRNLLPQPVTKTNEYTMKVTYDLIFQ